MPLRIEFQARISDHRSLSQGFSPSLAVGFHGKSGRAVLNRSLGLAGLKILGMSVSS